jgi:hypothetical protein
MFKDPLSSQKANEQAEIIIGMKTEKLVQELTNSNLSDDCFTVNLMNLCILNKMADSHKMKG